MLFVYPTIKMLELSFTNAPLIGDGEWIGFENYVKPVQATGCSDARSGTPSISSCSPWSRTTLIGLVIALMVNRLKGWLQSIILAAFFLPLHPAGLGGLPDLALDARPAVRHRAVRHRACSTASTCRSSAPCRCSCPPSAFITIWWTIGFNVLLFIAGLRNISPEIYEAASLDGANRWQLFRRITWPLIWPVTVLVLTIQLILQLKIFDQVYLFCDRRTLRSDDGAGPV